MPKEPAAAIRNTERLSRPPVLTVLVGVKYRSRLLSQVGRCTHGGLLGAILASRCVFGLCNHCKGLRQSSSPRVLTDDSGARCCAATPAYGVLIQGLATRFTVVALLATPSWGSWFAGIEEARRAPQMFAPSAPDDQVYPPSVVTGVPSPSCPLPLTH
jgi:hypothetical protein